ncbi:glycosyltransferase [Clostridium botulinum]|nr:glycosyltransferase [Clostridium botulinum]
MFDLVGKEIRKLKEIRTDIFVTVVCVTYNHEKYIRDCLEGIVKQRTNFKFQVFIGEDCSTDDTKNIIEEYVKKYPQLIIPFYREQNIGSIKNFGDLCERVDTKYITFCDGDDYWIDYDKLQKQFDYLEKNPDINGVCGRLKLEVPENWFLMDYYKKSSDGNFYQPDFLPGFKMPKDKMVNIHHMVNNNIAHAGAIMLRINPEIEKLPEWFYKSYIGDSPYAMLQVGVGKIHFTDDVVGIYRKHDGGVTNSTDFETNMLNTRKAYITYLMGVREFFIEHYNSYGKVTIENRVKQEVANYLDVLVKYEMDDKISELFCDYPEACRIALNAYLSFYWDSRRMTRIYSWEGNKTVARDRYFMHLLSPIIKTYNKIKKIKFKIKSKIKKSMFLGKLKNLVSLMMYLVSSLIPKKKNLWVFTSFRQRGYLDNSKYYFEYVTENNPEIEAVWLTRDKSVYNTLKKQSKNVYISTSFKGIWKMIRANIAITDHFRMTDYPSILGYNYWTKLVQLWHGVGLKSMGNGKEVKNTNVPGVKYSDDIICKIDDSTAKKVIKKFKYFRHAFFREMFEEYFMFVCPGQERIDMIGKIWNIPEEKYFMAGHPRNLPIYESMISKENLILYAPTYRFNKDMELNTVEICLSALENIQKKMEEIDGKLIIRLHPHTWRNYQIKIKKEIADFDRIELDNERDIYPNLGKYSIVISDYSSISFDFAMLDRPVIYLCHDYEEFIEREAGFNLDYFKNTPGPKTYTWEETLNEIQEYIDNPKKDSKMRKEICRYFFYEKANGIDNSERITNELKRRLKIK